MCPFQPQRTFLGVSAWPRYSHPRRRSSEARAASGSSNRGDGRRWHRTGRGCSLSLANGDAPALTPRAAPGNPRPRRGKQGAQCSPGCQGGQEHRRVSDGKEVPHEDLWPYPAPCAPSTSPTSPRQTVEWKTRPGPGKAARAGGGAETRRDPPGRAWCFSPGSAHPALLSLPRSGLGAASLVFLEGRDPSWLGWLNLGSAPNRG